MRIIFVVPMMTGIGGIQSSLLNLINNIKFEHEIFLCVLGNNIAKNTVIPENVKIVKGQKILEYIYLNYHERKDQYNCLEKFIIFLVKGLRRVFGFKRCLNLVKRHLRFEGEYDIAISYSNDIYCFGKLITGGPNDIVKSCICANKKIAWIHNDPKRLGFNYKICKNTYKDFTYIVNVSYACKKIFDEIIPEYEHKSKVVYNMFNIERTLMLSGIANPYKRQGFHIVTVARLDNKQKRIDRIINCCKKLKDEGIKNFYWHIVGDGPDRKWLELLSKERQVNDVLFFEGKKDNPYLYMKYADIFVLTSDYEAYGMVLTEALITGTPVISTNFPAASEVVSYGNNGIIVEFNDESIFKAIKTVYKNPDLIIQMKNYIKKNQISNKIALGQFEEIIGD